MSEKSNYLVREWQQASIATSGRTLLHDDASFSELVEAVYSLFTVCADVCATDITKRELLDLVDEPFTGLKGDTGDYMAGYVASDYISIIHPIFVFAADVLQSDTLSRVLPRIRAVLYQHTEEWLRRDIVANFYYLNTGAWSLLKAIETQDSGTALFTVKAFQTIMDCGQPDTPSRLTASDPFPRGLPEPEEPWDGTVSGVGRYPSSEELRSNYMGDLDRRNTLQRSLSREVTKNYVSLCLNQNAIDRDASMLDTVKNNSRRPKTAPSGTALH